MANLKIRKDDTVIVLSGDDKGKKGKVLATSPKERKVIVEGINKGGIIEVEGAMYADKVAYYCAKCGKGVRVAYRIEDGKKVRVCAKCGDNL